LSHKRMHLNSGLFALFALLFLVGLTGAQPGEGLYEPELNVERVAHPGPRDWTIVEGRPFLVEPGNRWYVYIEETESGVARSGGRETPIRQTRVRIVQVEIETALETDIAILEHESNRQINLLYPGDERLLRPTVASAEKENPWPNQCGFHFVDAPRALDFNEDDRNELAVRYYATHSDPAANGVFLIQPDESGRPIRLPLSTFVEGIRADDLHLRDLTWLKGRRNAVLTVAEPSLEDCRFLALLEIRGEIVCDNCCAFPALLARQENGKYAPMFDRALQTPLLDRLRADITLVASGTQLPLSSAEEAALARMASFYYLTGQGLRTRGELVRALGTRAEHFRTQLLLDRIDEHFLAPQR